MVGSGGAVPALMTELGVVLRLRDRRASRALFLLLEALARGGMMAEFVGWTINKTDYRRRLVKRSSYRDGGSSEGGVGVKEGG